MNFKVVLICSFLIIVSLTKNIESRTIYPTNICPVINSRSIWEARPPIEKRLLQQPVDLAIVGHTVTGECFSVKECSEKIRSMQNYHMDKKHFNDIAYNFLISGDGEIYEGVGFDRIGTHTKGYNTRSIGIGMIGTFSRKNPTSDQMLALEKLLDCAEYLEVLKHDYKLVGQRQVTNTESPGDELFRKIQNLPHWTHTFHIR